MFQYFNHSGFRFCCFLFPHIVPVLSSLYPVLCLIPSFLYTCLSDTFRFLHGYFSTHRKKHVGYMSAFVFRLLIVAAPYSHLVPSQFILGCQLPCTMFAPEAAETVVYNLSAVEVIRFINIRWYLSAILLVGSSAHLFHLFQFRTIRFWPCFFFARRCWIAMRSLSETGIKRSSWRRQKYPVCS